MGLVENKSKLREELQKIFDKFVEDNDICVSGIEIITVSNTEQIAYSVITNIKFEG